MAQRTLSEIYDAIAQEKDNLSQLDDWYTKQSDPNSTLDDHQTLLKDLTSSSKVAIWRLLLWVVAVATWIHEGLWYVFKTEVQELIDRERPHTLRWYAEQSKLWQYGDSLEWIDGQYQYSTYDASKQIVKYCSTAESAGVVLIKAAKEVAGVATKLTTAEKTSFENFWKKFKDAGVFINIISEDPDLVRIGFKIYYNPLVLTSTGVLIADGSTKPVEVAIESYLANLPWDGILRNSSVVDAVQQAAGVVDVVLTGSEAKANNAANYNAISRVYQSVSGHIALNDLNVSWNV